MVLPDFPAEYEWHWAAYCDLSSGRTSTGWGPSGLTWLDLRAWAEVRGVRLSALDVTILRDLDASWLQSYKEAMDAKERQGKGRSSG